jgi:hypothetical protein
MDKDKIGELQELADNFNKFCSDTSNRQYNEFTLNFCRAVLSMKIKKQTTSLYTEINNLSLQIVASFLIYRGSYCKGIYKFDSFFFRFLDRYFDGAFGCF